MNILNLEQLNKLDTIKVLLKSCRKTSKTRSIFTYDIYYLDSDHSKHPFLIQTPVLTISSNILYQNSYSNLFVAFRNMEYDTEIQRFYVFLTKIEYLIIQQLLNIYSFDDSYKSIQLLDKTSQEDSKFNMFINTDKCVTIPVNIKSNITTVFNRYKKIYKNEEVFSEGESVLKKNSRAQFILELPSIWIELNTENKIIKLGLNWTGIQIKLVELCVIEQCLIQDNVLTRPLLGAPPPPPPPPPPPIPKGGLLLGGGLKKIQPLDLLGGLNNLKKVDAETKKDHKPKNTNGFKPPSLDDILGILKKMKQKET